MEVLERCVLQPLTLRIALGKILRSESGTRSQSVMLPVRCAAPYGVPLMNFASQDARLRTILPSSEKQSSMFVVERLKDWVICLQFDRILRHYYIKSPQASRILICFTFQV